MPKHTFATRSYIGPGIINRTVAVIKPKQPLVDWLRSLPGWDSELTIADLRREDCTALLVPNFDYLHDSLKYVQGMYKWIFEMELASWDLLEESWPKKRTLKLFREWFDVELHSMIIDVTKGTISKEPL